MRSLPLELSGIKSHDGLILVTSCVKYQRGAWFGRKPKPAYNKPSFLPLVLYGDHPHGRRLQHQRCF